MGIVKSSKMSAEIALRRCKEESLPGKVAEAVLTRTEADAGRLLHELQIIDTLLDFSRIMRVDMKHEKVDLTKIVQEVVQKLSILQPNNCSFRFSVFLELTFRGAASALQR